MLPLRNGADCRSRTGDLLITSQLRGALDFPDFARHQMSYNVTSTRGVYEQRQTVYPRI